MKSYIKYVFAFVFSLCLLATNVILLSSSEGSMIGVQIAQANEQLEKEEENGSWRTVNCAPDDLDYCIGDGNYVCCK